MTNEVGDQLEVPVYAEKQSSTQSPGHSAVTKCSSRQKNGEKYALLQRHDTAVLAGALGDKLVRQGMVRNVADQKSFRDKLSASGFYNRWKEEFGTRAWTLLEQSAGPLSAG